MYRNIISIWEKIASKQRERTTIVYKRKKINFSAADTLVFLLQLQNSDQDIKLVIKRIWLLGGILSSAGALNERLQWQRFDLSSLLCWDSGIRSSTHLIASGHRVGTTILTRLSSL